MGISRLDQMVNRACLMLLAVALFVAFVTAESTRSLDTDEVEHQSTHFLQVGRRGRGGTSVNTLGVFSFGASTNRAGNDELDTQELGEAVTKKCEDKCIACSKMKPGHCWDSKLKGNTGIPIVEVSHSDDSFESEIVATVGEPTSDHTKGKNFMISVKHVVC